MSHQRQSNLQTCKLPSVFSIIIYFDCRPRNRNDTVSLMVLNFFHHYLFFFRFQLCFQKTVGLIGRRSSGRRAQEAPAGFLGYVQIVHIHHDKLKRWQLKTRRISWTQSLIFCAQVVAFLVKSTKGLSRDNWIAWVVESWGMKRNALQVTDSSYFQRVWYNRY